MKLNLDELERIATRAKPKVTKDEPDETEFVVDIDAFDLFHETTSTDIVIALIRIAKAASLCIERYDDDLRQSRVTPWEELKDALEVIE